VVASSAFQESAKLPKTRLCNGLPTDWGERDGISLRSPPPLELGQIDQLLMLED